MSKGSLLCHGWWQSWLMLCELLGLSVFYLTSQISMIWDINLIPLHYEYGQICLFNKCHIQIRFCWIIQYPYILFGIAYDNFWTKTLHYRLGTAVLVYWVDLDVVSASPTVQGMPINWKSEQNGRHFAENVFRCILWNENDHILIEIYIILKTVANGSIHNLSSLIGWRNCLAPNGLDELNWLWTKFPYKFCIRFVKRSNLNSAIYFNIFCTKLLNYIWLFC